MILAAGEKLNVAIACGGTGGHLFPGLAVAGQLARHGARITLMVSNKEVDQTAAKTVTGMRIVTLPAVGLTRSRLLSFLGGFINSYRTASRWFSHNPAQAVLAMGGFTSAPPVLAAKRLKAATFLHESNTIPGRANRWLSRFVDGAFVGFPSAGKCLKTRRVSVTGTPVRPGFKLQDAAGCRMALGLDPARSVALVMGGSQGAHGINQLIVRSIRLFARKGPDWQWVHLAGSADFQEVQTAYASAGLVARVYPFFAEMDLAMGAATASISRAGASSLAELAAMRLPSVLVPFPGATDDHQLHNAIAFQQSGAARVLDQRTASPEDLLAVFSELMSNEDARRKMQAALAIWDKPQAAEQIAQAILESLGVVAPAEAAAPEAWGGSEPQAPVRRSLESKRPESDESSMGSVAWV